MPQPDFTLTYRLVAEDFFALMGNRWRRRRASVIGLAAFVVGIGLWTAYQWWTGGAWTDLLGAFVLLTSPITVPMINRRAYRRIFEKQRLGTSDVRLAASVNGIDCDAATGRSHFPWSAIGLVEVTADHIFLWLHDYMGIVVPRRAFASPAAADAFAAFAISQAAGPKP
jgi:multisubunit Na+/H+ antiporter MnhG subunit